MELAIGAIITLIVQVLKKAITKLGSDWTLLIVVVLTYLGAYLFNWGKGFITEEMIASWGKIAGYQFMIWGVFVKYIWPKIAK